MRYRKLSILLICLLLIGMAYGAIDTIDKRKATQIIPFLPTPPIPDGVISVQDRAALAGVYWVYAVPTTGGWNRRRGRYGGEGYRSRYND